MIIFYKYHVSRIFNISSMSTIEKTMTMTATDSTDNTDITDNTDNTGNTIKVEEYCAPDTPLMIFISFCFFVVVLMTTVRTYRKGPPSLAILGSQCFMSMLCAFLLIGIGLISVYAEWGLMILFVLGITFFMISVLEPGIFFYSRTS